MTNRVSDIVREQGHQMFSNIINYNIEEYTARNLRKLVMNPGTKIRSRSFGKFGKIISTKFGRNPALTFLYGALTSQPSGSEKEKPAKREKKTKPRLP